MDTLEVASYSKVNLTLDVLSKRPDGYHSIDSVVQLIDLRDMLALARAEDGVIEVEADRSDVPSGRDNLVYRAAEAFFAATGIRAGVRCRLNKHIPAQAGLGGGSGDAAAAILGLDRLYETGLSRAEHVAVASGVGSDVSLFIAGGTLRMRGRGELLEELPDAPELSIVVARPDAGVSTAWAYAELDRVLNRASAGASDKAASAVTNGDLQALVENMANDFDPVVSEALGEVRETRDLLLQAGARKALLCGSGSAVFGVYDAAESASRAAEEVRRRGLWAVATRGVRRNEVQ